MAERIVSLLPSATEVLFFLGLGDRVVGVTYECAEPPEAAGRPHLTNTIIPPGASPGEINEVISSAVADGRELYTLDRELLRSLDPDLIVTQDLCRVCALPAGDVAAAVAELGCTDNVFHYDPMTLDGVIDEIERVASVAGAGPEAIDRVAELRARLAAARESNGSLDDGGVNGNGERPRVLLLEWVDPAFTAGHWIPDQIEAAGGTPLLAHPGGRSEATEWSAIAACEADVVIVAPCGVDAATAEEHLQLVRDRPEIQGLPAAGTGRIHAIDGDAHIVRPGPRLLDGVDALAELIR
ncbi:MAG: ABC transporter substrate-binding protein [Actinomycetota bacterium]